MKVNKKVLSTFLASVIALGVTGIPYKVQAEPINHSLKTNNQ